MPMVADGARPENQANTPEDVGFVLPGRGYAQEPGGGGHAGERRQEGGGKGGERAPRRSGERQGEEERGEAREPHHEAAREARDRIGAVEREREGRHDRTGDRNREQH